MPAGLLGTTSHMQVKKGTSAVLAFSKFSVQLECKDGYTMTGDENAKACTSPGTEYVPRIKCTRKISKDRYLLFALRSSCVWSLFFPSLRFIFCVILDTNSFSSFFVEILEIFSRPIPFERAVEFCFRAPACPHTEPPLFFLTESLRSRWVPSNLALVRGFL